MNMQPINSLSIIVPAYNEEKYLRPGIEAMHAEIAHAGRVRPGLKVEVVLVNNDSSDRTATIAEEAGYRVVFEKEHKIARVRNAGVEAATGEAILTVDADSCLGPGTLIEALETLEAGAVGGGCGRIRLDKTNFVRNIEVSAVLFLINRLMRLGGGIYFCRKADFEAVGGFDETLYAAEDLEFAERLKRHGAKEGRRFVNLKHSVLTTSARKLELFGRLRMLTLGLRTLWRPQKAIRSESLWRGLFYDVDNLR